MDITDIKLGMRVRTKLGKVGKVKEINRAGVVIELPDDEEYGAGFDCIEQETCTSGISIEDIRLGMELVTTGGIQGKVVAISKEGGLWLETADRRRFPVHVECVKPVREHVFYGDGSCNYDLCDGWAVAPAFIAGDKVCLHGKAKTVARCYNGQPDMLPLAEVAKCYKQVEPEQLLMSQEARRVIEYLKAADCPVHIGDIMDGMKHVMSCMAIMDGLIEAREAGIVRLDDGKYSIVRD